VGPSGCEFLAGNKVSSALKPAQAFNMLPRTTQPIRAAAGGAASANRENIEWQPT
jgi:hypothetical protein